MWKLHMDFKGKLLGMLFLFFNCVCVAAPVVKLTSESYKDAVSMQLDPIPNTPETEEENRLTSFSYVNQPIRPSLRKQNEGQVYYKDSSIHTALFPSNRDSQKSYPIVAGFLPRPGYYTFLYRHHLF
jgi:hypothetical protein